MTDPHDLVTGWHLNKSVSVGHIVTTMVVAVTAVFWISNIQHQVELNSLILSRAINDLDKHVSSGPHLDAEVRLVRLEAALDNISRQQSTQGAILRDIQRQLQDSNALPYRNFNTPPPSEPLYGSP